LIDSKKKRVGEVRLDLKYDAIIKKKIHERKGIVVNGQWTKDSNGGEFCLCVFMCVCVCLCLKKINE